MRIYILKSKWRTKIWGWGEQEKLGNPRGEYPCAAAAAATSIWKTSAPGSWLRSISMVLRWPLAAGLCPLLAIATSPTLAPDLLFLLFVHPFQFGQSFLWSSPALERQEPLSQVQCLISPPPPLWFPILASCSLAVCRLLSIRLVVRKYLKCLAFSDCEMY